MSVGRPAPPARDPLSITLNYLYHSCPQPITNPSSPPSLLALLRHLSTEPTIHFTGVHVPLSKIRICFKPSCVAGPSPCHPHRATSPTRLSRAWVVPAPVIPTGQHGLPRAGMRAAHVSSSCQFSGTRRASLPPVHTLSLRLAVTQVEGRPLDSGSHARTPTHTLVHSRTRTCARKELCVASRLYAMVNQLVPFFGAYFLD